MPVKKDESGKRSVQMDLVLPGTPEDVWRAIATGGGITAWFAKTEVEEKVGGKVRFDFGSSGSSVGEVTAWQPPERLCYLESDWKEGAPPVATEITVVGRAGDRCVVRMVHSLFATSDEWDDELEGFESGWPAFFEVLRLYLQHFRTQNAAATGAMSSSSADALATWQTLTRGLDLAGRDAGERWSSSGQPEALSGMVERVVQDPQRRYVIVRVESPRPSILLLGCYRVAGMSNASVSLFLYGDGAEQRAASAEPKWQRWLTQLLK